MGTETAPLRPSTPETDRFFYGWRYVPRPNSDGSITNVQVPLTEEDVLHPQEEDFIVHNDIHDDITSYLKNAFRWRLADRPGAMVLHDHRVDWQVEGIEPHGPDVVVLLDSQPWDRERGTFPVVDQGAHPVLVVEVTSPSTRGGDLDDKVDEYYRAGIPQYVVVDIRARAKPTLRLLEYRPSPDGPVRVTLSDPTRVWLPELNLWLAVDGDRVFCQERDGTRIPDYVGMSNLALAEKARAEQERLRAEAAEARIRELEEQLKRRNSSQP